MCGLGVLSLLFSIVSISNGKGLSYPKEECDWIGADQMHGPYLPIGVCKHIFNPYNLSTRADDHRYSHKYVCSEDGSVHARAWQNNSYCQGDNYDLLPVKTYGDDYFGCSPNNGACPYTVVRFYHQTTCPYTGQCIKSDDGWYSEAPNTVYQCLNNSHGWYMLQCTEDGTGLIGIDYTENCQEILNQTIWYNGCYEDKYIEITHCDYWQDAHSISTTTSTSSTTPPITITSTQSAVPTALNMNHMIVTNPHTDNGYEHHMDHDGYHSHSDSSDKHHHEHRNHHDHHDHPDSDQHNAHPQTSQQNPWIKFKLFIIAAGFCTGCFMVLCCWMTRKYLKQKKQIAEFKVMVKQYNDTDRMDEEEDGDVTTICLDEGETITFK